LPAEAFENMGAFGENTMTFDQWMQFVLVPRLREMVRDREEFPAGSDLAAYGIRALDGDPDWERLHDLLYDIDQLAECVNGTADTKLDNVRDDSVSLGGELPAVVYSLLEVLPQFEGDDLESQLQIYDTFLAICSPAVRPQLSALLAKAAAATTNATSRARIEQAAEAVARGDRAAEPYNHAEAMRKYREEHQRSFEPREESRGDG
jgi:uncharacterized protein YqcC (DUF446 family)